MNLKPLLHRLALVAGLATAAAFGVALPSAQAGETVEASVPMRVSVSGTQHTDWHMKNTLHDSCTDGDITYTHTGVEDLGFRSAGQLDGTLNTVHDDAGEIFTRLDVPPGAEGALVDLEANTHRDSHTEQTQVGGHEPECGGATEDPEPQLGPDCGTEEHTLTVKLALDRTGNLKVSTQGLANDEPFRRCSTPATLTSPRLAEVLDDTTTTITGQGDSRVATVVGRRTVHQPLPGGEAVTTVRWRVVLERVADDEEGEELMAPQATTSAPEFAAPPAAALAAPNASAAPVASTRRVRARSSKRRVHSRPYGPCAACPHARCGPRWSCRSSRSPSWRWPS